MISPEVLRRFPFFCCLNDQQQKAIAMVADQVDFTKGTTIFIESQPVHNLYVLLEGHVNLYYTASADHHDQFLVGEISPGEPFSISALIEPYTLTATAIAESDCHVLKIEAAALRALCEVDTRMGYALMRQVAKIALERLHFSHVKLAAAQA